MILRQLLHSDPVIAASYLVGCGGQGVSSVVDPMEKIEQYIAVSEASGMKIIPTRPPQADAIRARNLGVSAPASPAGS